MVSVIMPVYNTEKYIRESIESVLNQSYSDLELIIVDDGSIDKSPDIIHQLAEKNKQIVSIKVNKNKGVANARNTGITEAKGEFIMCLDSDDVLMPDAVSCLVKALNSTQADMAIGNYIYRYEERHRTVQGSFLEHRTYAEPEIIDCMHFSCILGNKMFRTDLIRKNGLKNPDLKMGEDLTFYHECLSRCKKIVSIKDTVMTYRMHEGSTSKTYDARIKDFFVAFQLIENNYEKCGLLDFKEEFLYDEFFYLVGNMKRMPRFTSKEERYELFDLLAAYGDSKDTSLVSDKLVLAIIDEFNKVKRCRWFYTSDFSTSVYRFLRKIKHKIGGKRKCWKHIQA